MAELPQLLERLEALRAWTAASARPVHFVPTLGNLHRGHLALVEQAARGGARVLVSIFVNPTQFGPGEDYARYPRTLADDLVALAGAPCAAVWLPAESAMYPLGQERRFRAAPPQSLSGVLCGAHRPGHFDGVCEIVLRLLWQVVPARLVLGEKDYQQLLILRRMIEDFSIPVEVEAAPTVREADGLALSSRNRYLDEAERQIAPTLHAELIRVADAARSVEPGTFAELERSALERLAAKGFKPEYVSIRNAEDLRPGTGMNDRVFGAACLGRARLIDNVAVTRQHCR